MSEIKVLYDYRNLSLKNGKKVLDEEYVIEGDKGLKIKYYHKDDSIKEKITITGKDGKYKKKHYKNDEVTENDLDEEQFKKELKDSKLKFAKEQLKGGAKKVSDLEGGAKKRGSKKAGSKKAGSKKAGSKKAGSKKAY
jgi:hypothetical protein